MVRERGESAWLAALWAASWVEREKRGQGETRAAGEKLEGVGRGGVGLGAGWGPCLCRFFFLFFPKPFSKGF